MANPTESNINLINALLGVPGKLFGSTQTTTASGGSSTTQTQFSQAGIDALLKQLMEGTTGKAGLAAIAGSQRAPGLYNSTTRGMLVNDLLARSAAEVEKARAPTVTTKEPTVQKTKTPGLFDSISPTGLLLGGALLAGGTKTGRDLISGLFSGEDVFGEGTPGLGAVSWDPGIVNELGIGGGAVGSAGEFFNFPANDTGYITDMFMQDYADFGMEGVASLGTALGGDAVMAGMAAADFADFGVEGLSSLADSASVADVAGGGGGYLSAGLKLAQGDVGGAAGTAAGAYLGNLVLPGVGGIIGGLLGGGGCFITTAVCQNDSKPDDCHELTVLRKYRDSWLAENHPEDIATYYAEAPEIVSRISSRLDAPQVWNSFNRDYIQPAVAAIESGDHAAAYTIYKNLFLTAKEIAHG